MFSIGGWRHPGSRVFRYAIRRYYRTVIDKFHCMSAWLGCWSVCHRDWTCRKRDHLRRPACKYITRVIPRPSDGVLKFLRILGTYSCEEIHWLLSEFEWVTPRVHVGEQRRNPSGNSTSKLKSEGGLIRWTLPRTAEIGTSSMLDAFTVGYVLVRCPGMCLNCKLLVPSRLEAFLHGDHNYLDETMELQVLWWLELLLSSDELNVNMYMVEAEILHTIF